MSYASQDIGKWKNKWVLLTDHFKLVSNCSRFNSNHGRSCIFVWKNWHNKEVNYLKGLGSENVFEMTIVVFLDLKFILACICRSPDGDFYDFFVKTGISNLYSAVQRQTIILCGDKQWFIARQCNAPWIEEFIFM